MPGTSKKRELKDKNAFNSAGCSEMGLLLSQALTPSEIIMHFINLYREIAVSALSIYMEIKLKIEMQQVLRYLTKITEARMNDREKKINFSRF